MITLPFIHKPLSLSWDWLLTSEDKREIEQARAMAEKENEQTELFLKRLKRIEPETIVTALKGFYDTE
jgi:hypothetical protein